MTTDRRLYDMDLGRRDHTRWLGSNRYAGGGPPPGPSLPIDWSTDLLFARASAATYWDGTAFTRYTSGTARILGDGSLYVEGSRTNDKPYSTGSDLVAGSGVTVTPNAANGPPAAGGDATRVLFNGSSNVGASAVAASEPTYPNNTGQSFSVFALREAGNDPVNMRMESKAAQLTQGINTTTSWVRYAYTINDNGSGSRAQSTEWFASTAPRTGQHLLWGWQLENAAFPSQCIETGATAATRLADDAVIEDADVPAAMRSGAFKITIKPRRASTQANDTTTGTLFAFGSGTDNRIYINASNQIVVRESGVDEVTTGALTWTADLAITLTFDASAGEVTVSGASTGNGTTTGTAWTMPSGDVQVGNDAALGTAFFGSISPPVVP